MKPIVTRFRPQYFSLALGTRAGKTSMRTFVTSGFGRFILAAALLGAGYLAWALNLSFHLEWTGIIAPVYRQLFSPESGFISFDLRGIGYALLAFLILFLTGVLSAELILPQEKDRWLKRLAALLLGFGVVGIITTLLAAFFQLHALTLFIALFVTLALLFFAVRRTAFNTVEVGPVSARAIPGHKAGRGQAAPPLQHSQIKQMFLVWKIGRDDFSNKQKMLLFIFCLAFFAIMEYQALRFIEIDWDALIYHANLAKLMFANGGVPVIAGPSAGLELSANYPPLFSSLGAYFYVFAGQINDTYIRMLAPIFSLINLLIVYKIGSALGDTRYGTIAVVLLLLTPLYFSRSLYATNYLPVTTFLSATLLFFLKWFQTRSIRYWLLFALTFGFALLTSLHALIFGPSLVILILLTTYWTENRERKRHMWYGLAALLLASAIDGIWLLRNTIYVHNPIYPFGSQWLGGLHFDPVLFSRTTVAIRLDSILNYFGTYTPGIGVYFQRLFINRSQFPVLSILLILGALLIPFDKNRRGWAVVGLYILPVSLLLASTLINIFTRYFVIIMPETALIVALLFTRILTWGNFSFVTAGPTGLLQYHSFNTVMHALAGILVGLMFVFPGNLAVVMGKQYGEADIYKPNYWKTIPGSQDVYGTLGIVYGEEVQSWAWLKPKASATERIASFENRMYYLTDNARAMLYLDGWEAKPMYAMTEPEKAFAYLQAHQVKYILDPSWTKDWDAHNMLPLDKFLGDPGYFPLVYDTQEAKIYRVGRVDDPLTEKSPLAINFSLEGWSLPERRQGYWDRIVARNTTNARLFVSYADQITLRVVYLDSGTSTVDFNVRRPDGTWDYSTHIIRTNSNRWLTKDLELPHIDRQSMVEIGIFSPSDDFVVRQLSAAQGK